MHNENRPEASVQKTLTASAPGQADRSSPIYPPVIKIAYRGNERVKFSDTCGKRRKFRSNCVGNDKAPTNDSTPKNRNRKSNEPSTAGGRERRLKARPPVRFSSLRSPRLVNQKQEPSGNTLLAQRYPLSGNSYFWRTALGRIFPLPPRSISAAVDQWVTSCEYKAQQDLSSILCTSFAWRSRGAFA